MQVDTIAPFGPTAAIGLPCNAMQTTTQIIEVIEPTNMSYMFTSQMPKKSPVFPNACGEVWNWAKVSNNNADALFKAITMM